MASVSSPSTSTHDLNYYISDVNTQNNDSDVDIDVADINLINTLFDSDAEEDFEGFDEDENNNIDEGTGDNLVGRNKDKSLPDKFNVNNWREIIKLNNRHL